MNLVHAYGAPVSKQAGIDLIRFGYDQGITLFDTAQVYGPYLDEEYVGAALKPLRQQVHITTKCGIVSAGGKQELDASRASIRASLEDSLRRLQTDYVDMLYLHRLDPKVPVEDVAGTMQELIQEGKIRHYGLSEVSAKTLRRAHAVHPVTAVQNEYSYWTRESEPHVIPACEELGVGFVPWSPLGQAYFTGTVWPGTDFPETDMRHQLPRFKKDAMEANRPLIEALATVGKEKGATPAQVELAWLLAQKPFIVPIPGTTKTAHLAENVGALYLSLSPADLQQLAEAYANTSVQGARTAPELAKRSDVLND
jgi:aryl-alcohol dehydrogenase-like predicted oxidoreductase